MAKIYKIKFVDRGQELKEMTVSEGDDEMADVVDSKTNKVFVGDRVNMFLTRKSGFVHTINSGIVIKYPVKKILYVKERV